MNIILLGPQGSGKGTQAKFLVEKFGFYHFEMGSFLRELAKTDKVINEIVNIQGKLVPDELFLPAMEALLGEKVKEGKNLLLDGFPRSLGQYEIVKNWFAANGMTIDQVIFINISEEETIRRLSGRRTCQVCGKIWNLVTAPIPPSATQCECGGELKQREDDQPERIKARLAVYRQNTEPALALFKKDGILKEVNGERPIEEIQTELAEIVEGFKNA